MAVQRDATIREATPRRAAATASLRPDLSTHSFQCSWYRRTSFLMSAKLALGFLEAIMWNNFSRSGLRSSPFSLGGTTGHPSFPSTPSTSPSDSAPRSCLAPQSVATMMPECS